MFKRFFSSLQPHATEQLENLYKIVQSVNSMSSTIQKRSLLAESQSCHSTLKRIYDPHLRHFLSSKTVQSYIQKLPHINHGSQYNSLDQLLDALSSRTITGKEALEAVAAFYATYCKTEAQKSIFWRVLDRNLKMGVSTKTIRHLLSSTNDQRMTLVQVALAHTLGKKKLDFTSTPSWYASQKLDGIRCITLVRSKDDCDIQFMSRTGRPFCSLQKVGLDIQKRLKETKLKEDFVLDGEICVYNESGKNEVFSAALSQIRKLNEEMEVPIYQIFDFIPMDVFINGFGEIPFSCRQERLKAFLGNSPPEHLRMVQQVKLTSEDQLNQMQEEAAKNGWEGLILRRDVAYEGKRTNDLLKVKEWEDSEYIVKSIETSYQRMPDTGEDKLVLKSVNIEHKGHTVSVGSGFSMNERIAYANDPSLIIGKPITVRYFSESFNRNGTISLRFPTVKAVYEQGERDV
ncbi:DNA ligase/mRNA capping enzyme [Rhizopus microsporus var. microsporus]|uniref:DNA ligase/mRNA capping enzyme n=1 Tax=Rhizopus microsporus var. microsporus TaxID=86635 RepID=A0A1X0RCG9_RHIZD|nr:DNA ligase/mRNA capping enzyme [Rhizopus microsporus var. microsporus]